MIRLLTSATPFLVMGMLFTSTPASAFTQIANIKALPAAGSGLPQGGKNVLLDSYLATRDPDSTRSMKKTNPVGSVNITFPVGSLVNKSAVGAANVCNQSEYTAPSLLAVNCSRAVIGTGWALLNDGNIFPTIHEQIDGAPAACTGTGLNGQYSRTWASNPAAGPDCIPVGDIYVKITAYQGGILKSKYWCYGMDSVNKTYEQLKGKKCYFKDATKQPYNFSDSALNNSYNAAKNGCNIIFANSNALAPLSFGGSANNCSNTLSVVIPALNGTGSGLGELTGGFVLSDFYLKTVHPTYLKAGACPKGRQSVITSLTYSKLLGETSLPASNPASKNVVYSYACKK